MSDPATEKEINSVQHPHYYLFRHFLILPSGLTSPAEGTGQLAAQEAASNDCDGLDVSGDLIQ